MPLCREIQYLHEPTPLQCGQAVLAMLGGCAVEDVVKLVGTDRETTLPQMFAGMDALGIHCCRERIAVQTKAQLPAVALLSLETPRCWHWSLYCDGVFYDPEHGVMDDFPLSKRRYYWKIDP